MADIATNGHEIGGRSLLEELSSFGEEILASLNEMERVTNVAVPPESSMLSPERLRFSRALRRHLQYVDGKILPYLFAVQDMTIERVASEYRNRLYAYHEASAHHVARWPSTSVTQDWPGYKRAVAEMIALLRERIELERRDIYPLLAKLEKPPT